MFTRQDVEEAMAAYEGNTRRIVDVAGRAGVPLVLGTVPSNLYRPTRPPDVRDDFVPIFSLYLDGEWEPRHARAGEFLPRTLGLHQSSATENAILRRVAAETGTALADAEARAIAIDLLSRRGRQQSRRSGSARAESHFA